MSLNPAVPPSFRRGLSPSRLLSIALLLVLAYLQLSTLSITSPTMDEPSHILAGYAFLSRGDTRINRATRHTLAKWDSTAQ